MPFTSPVLSLSRSCFLTFRTYLKSTWFSSPALPPPVAQTTSSRRAQEPPGLVSWGCHNKVRQTRTLKTTNVLSPGFRGQKYEVKVSTVLHSFPRLSSRILPCFFQLRVASDIFFACGHIVPVAASSSWLLPVSFCVSCPLLGLSDFDLEPTISPGWFHLKILNWLHLQRLISK